VVIEFHKRKKAAAVLKHAILNRYVTPFASKTGSRSERGRVAFIDGYAGPGRYEDESEGSGAMLLRKAKELAAMNSPRQLECHFVEADKRTAARLEQVAAGGGEGVTYTVTKDNISNQLPVLLQAAKGIPLFVYLDPCGLPIPFDEVAAIFDRPSGLGEPATEALINITAGLRRFAGMLTSDKDLDLEKDLKPLDTALGGDWWRSAWLEHCPVRIKDATEEQQRAAEFAVVTGYAQRLSEKAGGAGTWIIDVKPRVDLKPVYYLLFVTRHPHGLLLFGESASLGLKEWRRYFAEQEADDTLFGEAADWEASWKAEEKKLDTMWVDTIADRLTAELVKGKAFRIAERVDELLGEELAGVVRTLHLRAAINKVRKAGLTGTDPKGVDDLYRLWITPAAP
jgi:three-Cys-motif partner protein